MDFICECGKRQRKNSPRDIITEKDAEKFGWRKINNKWRCPICCNNKANMNNIHDIHDCSCAICSEGSEKIILWQEKCMKQQGWYAHIIMDDPSCPFNYNIHTHGIPKTLNHPDLQICLPMDPKIAHNVIGNIVSQIKGVVYKIGILITDDKVLSNDIPFLFVKAKESNRDILRIIFSDEHKNIDKDTMEYKDQWEGTSL